MLIQRLMKFFFRIISVVLIGAILAPDFVRAMEDEFDNKQTQVPFLQSPNKQKTSHNKSDSESSENSSSSEELKLPLSNSKLVLEINQQISPKKIENDSDSSSPPNTDSHSLTPSPPKNVIQLSVASNLTLPQEEKKEERVIDLKILPINTIDTHIESQKKEQSKLDLEKFSGKLGGNEGKDSPQLIDIQKGAQEHKLGKSQVKGDTKSSNHSGIMQIGNVIYLGNEKDEKEIDLSTSRSNKDTSNTQQNLGDKFKKEKTISFEKKKGGLNCLEEIFLEEDSSQSFFCKEPKKIVQFLKESFLKQLKLKEKLEEQFVSSQSSINFDSSEIKLTEKDPLIKKDVSMKKEEAIEDELPQNMKDLQERFANLLTQDEEKTATAFEEWAKTAEKRLLLEELKNFFMGLPFLQDILFQAAKEMIEKTPNLKKLTVQDWMSHMGLTEGKQKVEILSPEIINFYELFNKAVAFHVASTLSFNQDPSEEDIKAFKSSLLHLKDFTIDGKLTWKQIGGALLGAAVGGVAAYAFYLVYSWGFFEIFLYYQKDLNGGGAISNKIAKFIAGLITFDAVVRNAKLGIDWLAPSPKNATLSMNSKDSWAVFGKKTLAYVYSLLPALIPLYYYSQYTQSYWRWKFYAFGGFLYLNSLIDNASRLVNNVKKGAQDQHFQEIEENFPPELEREKTNFLESFKKSQAYLKTASQKEINERYEEVYGALPSTVSTSTPDNQKLSQVLHLILLFLDMGNLELKESPLLSSNSSMKDLSSINKQEKEQFIEEEKDEDLILSPPLKIQELKVTKPKTFKEKIAQWIPKTWQEGAAKVLPVLGSTILTVGARYMVQQILQCGPGICWQNDTGIEAVSDIVAGLTLMTVSYVQHASIKKNTKDLARVSKTKSQPPLRKGWEIANYVVAGGFTIPDFMLWAYATSGWNPILKYTLMSFATLSEIPSTADSLNDSSNNFITGVNRIISLCTTKPPEGFRRQKLSEINQELQKFIQTFKPEVLKIFLKILPSFRKAWKEGTDIQQEDLKKLFDPHILKAFTEFSKDLKEKRQKTESEMKEFIVIEEKKEKK